MATYSGNHILTSGKSSLWSTLTIGTATNNPLTYVVPVASGGQLASGNSTHASITYRIYTSYLNGSSGSIYDTGNSTDTNQHNAGVSWTKYSTRNVTFTKQKTAYSAYIRATLYTNGSTSTATYSFTVPAITSYAITYSANGGEGAPESQSKWHDEAVTLSSTIPTRNGFAFKGWSTSSTAETVDYTAGATYTANSAVVLYAVWELLQDIRGGRMTSAYRCDSNGTAQDDGTYAKFVCSYTLLGAGQNNGSVTAQYKPTSSSTWTTVSSSLVTQNPTPSKSASVPSLEVTVTVGAVPNFSQDSSYDVRVIARDSAPTPHEVTMTGTISVAYFTMDFAEGGKGIGIGTPISKSETTGHSNGLLKVAMDTAFSGGVTFANAVPVPFAKYVGYVANTGSANQTWSYPSSFGGLTYTHDIGDESVFSPDQNGFIVKKSGWYIAMAHTHFNTGANNIACVLRLYSSANKTGLNMYGQTASSWCGVVNHWLVHLEANEYLVVQVQKYTSGSNYRPSQTELSVMLLKED